MIAEKGGFIEVYLSTPITICEERNPKGIYTKARAGLIKNFTGISDPYEIPENPEVELDTSQYSIDESVDIILEKIRSLGYLP
jgi:sulfate adenylyltransferase